MIQIMLALILSSLAAAHASEVDDPIAGAVFAQTPQAPLVESPGRKTIGIVHARGIGGLGVAYHQKLMPSIDAWIMADYEKKSISYNPHDFTPSKQVAYVEFEEHSRFDVRIGIDRTFHLTKSKYWGFILGLGLGLTRTEYHARFYPEYCSWGYCGIAPTPTEHTEPDVFVSTSGRAGVAFRSLRVGSIDGDLIIAINPLFHRWPRRSNFVTGPDGRAYNRVEFIPITIETLLEL